MSAVARVSRKIPTPRPRPAEVRESAILFLSFLALTSLMRLPRTGAVDQHVDRRLSAACSSLSDRHPLVGAYGNCSEIQLANPEIQLIGRVFHRPSTLA